MHILAQINLVKMYIGLVQHIFSKFYFRNVCAGKKMHVQDINILVSKVGKSQVSHK